MKKHLFFAATALAMLASCSQSDDLSAPVVAENTQPQAIEFGTYVGKGIQTRAGWVGDITDTQLQSNTAADGFGVFAFYTGLEVYPNVTSSSTPVPVSVTPNNNKPNFMYNQQVTWNGTSSLWKYTPLKYWPNDFSESDVDNQSSAATGSTTYGGKLSFFAYAPYVTKADADADASTGTGIIGMSANNFEGNPTITYKMASSGKNVDLLWGTCPTDAAGNYNVAPSGTQNGGYVWGNQTTPTAAITNYGKTNVNLTKQTTDDAETDAEKVNFLFKHALAKVGGSSKGTSPASSGLQIRLDPDFGTSFGKGNETVVTVDHIKISQNDAQTTPGTYDNKKSNQGVLDLATGIWTTTDDQDNFSQTIKESASADNEAEINPNIKEKTVNTSVDLITNTTWADATGGLVDGTHEGVLMTAQPVYDETKTVTPLLYFPGEIPSLNIEIEYVVRTKDKNLENGYSEVKQKITKTVTFPSAVEMNKRYNLMIILGLTSVKFEATVSNWEVVDNALGDTDGDSTADDYVYLPLNVK